MLPINRSIAPDLSTWGLSAKAIEVLSQEPEILADLAQVRTLPPLPPGYCPIVIEVLFEDVPYMRSEYGEFSILRKCLPNYEPRFIEVRVDDETALFEVGGEIVVNRLEAIAQMWGRFDDAICY
jgi:hypothetical protein